MRIFRKHQLYQNTDSKNNKIQNMSSQMFLKARQYRRHSRERFACLYETGPKAISVKE